jgi:hypothetical protein
MKLTAEMAKDTARRAGCGDVAIGNIDRWANAPRMMHPENTIPDCRSVISIVQQIQRDSYRGITEGEFKDLFKDPDPGAGCWT